MTEPAATVELLPDVRNVGGARRMLREVLGPDGSESDADAAVLALSEIVTNAFVHTGTGVTVRVWTRLGGIRVEVEDGGTHLPARRQYADTAGTGRGLQLVEEVTDRWGSVLHDSGKTVWFEIGEPTQLSDETGAATGPAASADALTVTLRRTPLLMHWAWQEHAAALLREHLLHVLDEDLGVLDQHAAASEALSLLREQLPAPELPEGSDQLLASAREPQVTAEEVVLSVPPSSVAHFAVLDSLLRRAVVEAQAGRFLSPPTQPEMSEMGEWLCSEVAKQSSGQTTATPWVARTDVRLTLADQSQLLATYAELSGSDEHLLATDEASIIVAASSAAVALLGYERAEDLLGRRVIVVVPERFHQAHIAGTTLNATNGRDVLLGVPLTVPMVRADGSEVEVSLEVCPEKTPSGERVFVARFQPAQQHSV